MGVAELGGAVLIAGVSCINAVLPAVAGYRSGDGRFLLLASANAVLSTLGAIWAWGQLPFGAPGWSAVSAPVIGFVLLVSLLVLASTLWPRPT